VRALEELGFFWFEEPVRYHVRAMGEVAWALNITVNTASVLQISSPPACGWCSGQRQDGCITGLMQSTQLCHAHGVERVPHQTQPTIGDTANMRLMATVMHLAKPVEVSENPRRLDALFKNAPGAAARRIPGAVWSGPPPRPGEARAAPMPALPSPTSGRSVTGCPDAATSIAPR